MRVNLKFLSEKANLSITSVSLILNGKDVRIAPEKKKLVLELAEKYNYTPNSIAVGLVTKKTRTIGLIIPDITNLFFAEIAKKVEQFLNKEGYSVILCNTNDDTKEEKKYTDLLLSRGIDALIICLTAESVNDTSLIEKLSKQNVSCVAFDRWDPLMGCGSVTIDNENGAYSAVDYLIKRGHKKIGCITGPMASDSSKFRLQGYRKALLECDIPINEELIYNGDYQFNSGYLQGLKLLVKDISAVFICNDMMAYGFYKAARELNKKIPDDISVIGFDDLLFSEMLDVPLTSIKQNTDKLSKCICEMVLKELAGKSTKEHTSLKTSITERCSVKNLLVKVL